MTIGQQSFQESSDQFLVCGLGSLGQHCVVNLKTFGVRVKAIDLVHPKQWDIPTLPDLLDDLLVGDCRHTTILEQADVRLCRAILLVTTDERVNLEAALTARLLNPNIRLVMRSNKQNLNDLLTQQLDNFVGFEPSHLAAPAFALESFGDDLLSFFTVGHTASGGTTHHRFRVVKQTMNPQHPWCNHRVLHELESRDRRILRHLRQNIVSLSPDEQIQQRDNPYSPSAQFYTWLPNMRVQQGDVVISIEVEHFNPAAPSSTPNHPQNRPNRWHRFYRWLDLKTLTNPRLIRKAITQFWNTSATNQIRRVVILCGIMVIIFCSIGTVLMRLTGVVPSLVDGFYTTVVLLLGGYGDVFGELSPAHPLPWWLRLFSLFLTLAGTAFIGVLYALLTEKLLTLKFEFLTRRPPVPSQDHVVVIWLGRVGRRIVELLQDLKQPVVGITNQTIDPDILPKMPLVTGRIGDVLENANVATAKSVVMVSDDEIQNLELGLLAHRVNPGCNVILRTYDQRFTNKVAQLFPYAHVLCASALSAEAFAGAAFGENVISLFRLYHQTVLVTQYDIEADDTLNGLLLADIAYGYGVVPIWHQRGQKAPRLMPSDDIDLQVGDRLVVLATIRGLRRVEDGDLAPKLWQVKLEQIFSKDAELEGGGALARISGCDIQEARRLMKQLPTLVPHFLYRHQALRLVRKLEKSRVQARIVPPGIG